MKKKITFYIFAIFIEALYYYIVTPAFVFLHRRNSLLTHSITSAQCLLFFYHMTLTALESLHATQFSKYLPKFLYSYYPANYLSQKMDVHFVPYHVFRSYIPYIINTISLYLPHSCHFIINFYYL